MTPRRIVGPMSCQECGESVYFAEITERVFQDEWRSKAIVNEQGERHECLAVCVLCEKARVTSSFPYGRPRRNGTRRTMRICTDCLEDKRHYSDDQRRLIRRVDKYESRQRAS